ncbi:hypothetical protein NC01_10075 [Streptococcus uberis]|nr:hypothetical protein NC01_10075 [Streptococcus uberis]
MKYLILVLSVAKQDDRIEVILLNGSRANQVIPKDNSQDYDIVFVTNFIEAIIADSTYYKQLTI